MTTIDNLFVDDLFENSRDDFLNADNPTLARFLQRAALAADQYFTAMIEAKDAATRDRARSRYNGALAELHVYAAIKLDLADQDEESASFLEDARRYERLLIFYDQRARTLTQLQPVDTRVD